MKLATCGRQMMKDDRSSFIVHRSSFRPAFTLVELLVVIAIIAILFSLTSAAVIKVIGVAEDTANRTSIGELEVAVAAFKKRFDVPYLPARIKLGENLADFNTAVPLDRDSLAYLKQVFGNNLFVPIPPNTVPPAIDWNGDGTPGNSAETLEGDQCLVFFLGGIPAQNGVLTTGFSTNPRDPSWHVRNGGDVVQPFFEFRSTRLVKIRPTSRYYSYMDHYGRTDGSGGPVKGKPYAYFSSYKAGNDYERYGGSDCNTLSLASPMGLAAYHEPGAVGGQKAFHNRTGFQIISAGVDGVFGPGGAWSPTSANGIAQPGRDDQSNFYDRKLGTGQ